jgi:twitching motility protein PilT
VEVLVGTATVRDCLLESEKSQLIPKLIEDGVTEYGMQSFDQSLLQLYQRGMITLDVARKFSTSPTDFELKVAGVVGASDRSMRFFDQEEGKEGEPPEESGPQEPSEGT